MSLVEELEEVFWSQYPVDQYIRVDGDLLSRIIVYIEKLEKDLLNVYRD